MMRRRRTCRERGCQQPATHGDYCYECGVATPAPLWKG